MNKIKLGNTDIELSKIGLGTWAIGGGPAWGGDKDERESIETIKNAPHYGVNLIDTAPGYNFGNSETIVGRAIDKSNRQDYVIITKCGIIWEGTGALFNKVGDIQLYKNLSKESILSEIEQSMERLNTDYIDIYMTHWQAVEPYKTPIKETMEVLTELKKQGKIKAIGAANISPDEIKEYLKYGELDIVQAKYSILDRNVEADLFSICKENNIILQAYSPLEQGLLTGTMDKNYVPIAAQANKKWFQPDNFLKVLSMLEKWKPLCEKYNTTIATLALAWLIAQGDFITILSGATTRSQIEQNAEAMKLVLEQEDIDYMRKLAETLEK